MKLEYLEYPWRKDLKEIFEAYEQHIRDLNARIDQLYYRVKALEMVDKLTYSCTATGYASSSTSSAIGMTNPKGK